MRKGIKNTSLKRKTKVTSDRYDSNRIRERYENTNPYAGNYVPFTGKREIRKRYRRETEKKTSLIRGQEVTLRT